MAHDLSMANGRVELAYAGATPWHGLGTQVEGLQTVEAMLGKAGLTWTVSTQPLACNGRVLDSHVAIQRDDTQAVLGVATSRYHCIQNAQAGDLMDAMVTEGGAHVEVAGALKGGAICWLLAHVPGTFDVVPGDAVRPYALLAWGHDGWHGLAAKLTPVRVVCKNTLGAAGFTYGEGADGKRRRWKDAADVYVKHSKNASVNLAEAQKALGLVRRQVEQTAEAYKALAATKLDDAAVASYFTAVFPAPLRVVDEPDDTYGERLAKWTGHQGALAQVYADGMGHDIPGVRGTAWGAYNAITEWVDHVYPVLADGKVSARRLESVATGTYLGTKRTALHAALALAGKN